MDAMIGMDLAKSVFQLHGAPMSGEVKFRKKLTRLQFDTFLAGPCNCCHGSVRWSALLGHEVKLIAPQYVRPFIKRQKIDAADAEAIVIEAQRPEMRFVDPKTINQQARAAVSGSRAIDATADRADKHSARCAL